MGALKFDELVCPAEDFMRYFCWEIRTSGLSNMRAEPEYDIKLIVLQICLLV
jgi:hypothetical protein